MYFEVVLHLLFAQFICCMGASSLHWYAPFYSGGGYSSEALDFVSAAVSTNISVVVYQHGDSINNRYVHGMLSRSNRDILYAHDFDRIQTVGIFGSDGVRINICHSEPGAWSVPTPKYRTSHSCPPPAGMNGMQYNIGRTMFETNTIPSGWANRINFMDEIWVPTEFSRKAFINAGVDMEKLRVMPEPVDTNFYRPVDIGNSAVVEAVSSGSLKDLLLRYRQPNVADLRDGEVALSEQPTIFLFVGKWERRKGVKELLVAFLDEFCSNICESNVFLVILSSQYHSAEPLSTKLLKILAEISFSDGRSLPPVILLEDIDQIDLPVMYSLANAVVIPSFGEGWGRPHVEALSCGTPVIATNWSGVAAYLTTKNGYPIAIEDQLVESTDWKGHYWAAPLQQSLRMHMRAVHTDHAEAHRRGLRGREDMIKSYSLDVMGLQLDQEMRRIETNQRSLSSSDEL